MKRKKIEPQSSRKCLYFYAETHTDLSKTSLKYIRKITLEVNSELNLWNYWQCVSWLITRNEVAVHRLTSNCFLFWLHVHDAVMSQENFAFVFMWQFAREWSKKTISLCIFHLLVPLRRKFTELRAKSHISVNMLA